MTDAMVKGTRVPLDYGIERREFAIRSKDEAARTVTGIAVPWDTPADIGGYYTETVARGAVEDSDEARLWWAHSEPIGVISATRDTEEGWEITARISETSTGDDAYTLLRDGVVDKFSIGFEPIESVVDEDAETVTRTRIRVREVSLVPLPAYESASVTEVRSKLDKITPDTDSITDKKERDKTMGDTISKADVDELRTGLEDVTRRLDEGIQLRSSDESEGMKFRSFGEYVKAIAQGDEAAQRAWTGATTGDTVQHDGWLGNVLKIMGERQRVLSLFQHSSTLPAQGMNVEYGQVETDTTQVAKQADQGDDLLYGKVTVGTKTAPVHTLGGWSSASRQAIERTSVNVLDLTWTALAAKYAKAIEMLTRSTVTGALDTADEVEGVLTTQDGIVAAILDLSAAFEDADLDMSGLLVSSDVFSSLLTVTATDRVLQINAAPADRLGSATLSSATANIAGVPVTVFPGAAAGTAFAYDKLAVKTLEAPGAPLRLQDANVVNLTQDFSIYGYAASFVQFPAGLIKIVAA